MSLVEAMRLPPEGNLRTFSEDQKLPPLPLPPLSHTLQRYLDSVQPFVSPSEFENTKAIVEEFQNGDGKMLHEKLQMKANAHKNWIEEWWEDKAYLENRLPLLPFCSMTGVTPLEHFWKFGPGKMVKYASLWMFYTIEMWKLLRSELLVPTQSADGKIIFSMNQFRRLFNCCRIPLPNRDRLDIHFKTEKEGSCPMHVLVACNGHLYIVDAFDEATGTSLNPLEWEQQLEFVLDDASQSPGQGISILTCDDRETWAKNYCHLRKISGENSHNLHLIESAVCMLTLEPSIEPKSASELTMASVSGNYKNVWADKSVHIIFFGNGTCAGLADHTAFDGMISITNSFYIYQSLVETGGVWSGPSTVRALPPPRNLSFVLDLTLKRELIASDLRLVTSKSKVIIVREKFSGFGKSYTVKNRIHPDTFVQMALQLTYYRMHQRLAPCYETATTRAFFNGRTETLRPCTVELTNWIKTMLDKDVEEEKKVKLLRIAAQRHDELMKEAREGYGCDRHLFGLYCIAEENHLPLPKIFTDPSFVRSGGNGNFVLSTSLVGYTPVGGGVAPMCLNGYGVFYNICPNSLFFTVSVMRDSTETSATKFFQNLCETFYSMQDVIEKAKGNVPTQQKAHL